MRYRLETRRNGEHLNIPCVSINDAKQVIRELEKDGKIDDIYIIDTLRHEIVYSR